MSGTDGLVTGGVPGLEIDLTQVGMQAFLSTSNCSKISRVFSVLTFQVLHGEQYIKVVKPMPAAGTLTNVYKVQDVLDKGRGMLLLVEIETRDEEGDLLLVNQSSIFVVGAGGFGGSRSSEHSIEVRKPPSRSPDATTSYKTNKDQAALYRMTGDLNRGQRDSSKSMFFTSKNLQFFGLHLNSYTQLIFAPLLDIFWFLVEAST